MSETLQKDFCFFLKVQRCSQNEFISICFFTVSLICKNKRATYSHKHWKMMMKNVLTSSGVNTMSFLTIHISRKYITWTIVF